MKQIFVDGYNVISSWPELKNIKEYSYEGARSKLIDLLLNYSAFMGCKIILVFDAHMVKGSIEKKEKMGNLIVVFTKHEETADSYIERIVNNIGRKSEIYVVTSDALEQQLIFQRGANRVSSLEFHNWIDAEKKKISKQCENKNFSNKNLFAESIDSVSAEKLEKIRRSR
ncbi:MAG: NYN domain-containing protein [Clostridium sp.]|uniref:NYN domain-containing protein n=1 Tax=Clostridium sp. TaxID=1506 RepID=UPI003023CE7E